MRQQTVSVMPKIEPIVFNVKGTELFILPVVHNSVLFAEAASRILQEVDEVLIEFPEELEEEFRIAIERLPCPTVIHSGLPSTVQIPSDNIAYFVHPGDATYWAAFLAIARKKPFKLVDTYTVQKSNVHLHFDPEVFGFLSWEKFYANWDGGNHFDTVHATRSCVMARRLGPHLKHGKRILFVVGIAHVPVIVRYLERKVGSTLLSMHPTLVDNSNKVLDQKEELQKDVSKESNWHLSDIHPHSLYLIMNDFPYVVKSFVESFAPDWTNGNFLYLNALRDLFFDAHKKYKDKFSDSVSPASFQRMFQYLRNLTRLRGKVVPSMFDVLLYASGMSDGDFAFEVYKKMVSYDFLPEEEEKLDTAIKVIPDERTKRSMKFVFKRRLPRPVLQRVQKDDPWEDLDPIPEEDYPGHWEEIWNKYSNYNQVSYPPEDVYIENYFHMLRRKAQEILSEEKVVVEEFKTSLEDGIDWGETIRNWYDKKIFVRRVPKIKPKIGALIIQFQAEQTEEFSHTSVLFAEHGQESDISIVSTKPGDTLIGPGIARIKLAAVVSIFPPHQYGIRVPMTRDDFTTRLLYTAINMAIDKVIVLVSPVRPNSMHRYFVSLFGYRLLYLPMQQLTRASLHRLRTMHILAHRDLRDIAKHYIGF